MLGRLSPFAGTFYYNSYGELLHDDYSLDFGYLYQIVSGMIRLPEAFYASLKSAEPKEYGNFLREALGTVRFRLHTPVTGLFYNNDRQQMVVQSIPGG